MKKVNRVSTSLQKLLLVDCDDRIQEMLTKSLRRLGMEAIIAQPNDQHIMADVVGLIVEIDELKSRDLVSKAREEGVPIVALSRHETLSQIDSAIRLGATAMLNRPVTQSSIYTTLMMARGLRDRINILELKNIEQAEQLRQRPQIAKAVAKIMIEEGLNERDAFERIRALSMKLNLSIEAICVDIEQRSSTLGIRN